MPANETPLDPSLLIAITLDRVTLDSGILLGRRNREFIAAADLGYYRGHWSSWIVSEFARVRTEWIAMRAVREHTSGEETDRRLERSRAKVNEAINTFSRILTLVDYMTAADADLSWLEDVDDHPIMQTAIAAGVPGTLVTDNRRDFPLGQVRNEILILGSETFLKLLYQVFPDAKAAVEIYLGELR